MYTIQPSITGHARSHSPRTNDHFVQQRSTCTALENSTRNVTPITKSINYLRKSAPKVGDAFHFVAAKPEGNVSDEKDELIRLYRQRTGSGFFSLFAIPTIWIITR